MQYVKLINRSSKDIHGTWDGRIYPISANGTYHLPRLVAEAIKRQNPIMGSDDEQTGNLEYLCGIEEDGDILTPIEQSDEIELYNRQRLKNAQPVIIIPSGVHVRATDVMRGLPADGSFVKP